MIKPHKQKQIMQFFSRIIINIILIMMSIFSHIIKMTFIDQNNYLNCSYKILEIGFNVILSNALRFD